jgi:enolase
MNNIKEIIAREIMDSRGKPTVEVEVTTHDGTFIASCPSGTSSGKNEALELRDQDGRGVLKAIENVNNIIAPKLKGKDCTKQEELDQLMIALDGTENKSKLGANAILPVSMAICCAAAAAQKLPLYKYIHKISNCKFQISNSTLPLPSFNILNGGAHADNDLDFQEFMVMPQKKLFSENLVMGSNIFNALTQLLQESYGKIPVMGLEGGYAPALSKAEQALYLLKNAIGSLDAKIAMDCAASEFYQDGKYIVEGKEFSRLQLLEFYQDLVARFDIISIEDPFAEEDWLGFEQIRRQLAQTIIIGDDLTTTNIQKIKEAEQKKACGGIIIKLNQIGSVTETIQAVQLAQSYGWKIMVSHRSGETMDTFIADLAVGVGADFIKAGSPSKPERMVKYNRLLEIETELHKK